MSDHEQIQVFCPAYQKAIEVDIGIAPLLLALWEAEIFTCNSCEEIESGIMWIEFYSNEDAEKLLLILIKSLESQIFSYPEMDDWFCYRILGQDGETLRPWQYYAHPNVSTPRCDQRSLYPRNLKACKVDLSVSLRFPREDYSKVLGLLRNYIHECDINSIKTPSSDETCELPWAEGQASSFIAKTCITDI